MSTRPTHDELYKAGARLARTGTMTAQEYCKANHLTGRDAQAVEQGWVAENAKPVSERKGRLG